MSLFGSAPPRRGNGKNALSPRDEEAVRALFGSPRPLPESPTVTAMRRRPGLMEPRPPVTAPKAQAKAHRPNVTARLGNYVADALMGAGLKKGEAVRLGHRVTKFLADVTPGGNADGILYPTSDFERQLSMLPLPGPAKKAVIHGLERGIKAYHGSPHDFDKFDISKIGSGEGAQAYGHGLYFAENPDIARSYMGSAQVPQATIATLALEEAGGNRERAIELLERSVRPGVKPEHSPAMKAAQELRQGYAGQRLYEVEINAPRNALLDWDRPVGEQPQLPTLFDLARENKMTQGLGLESRAGAFYQGLADSLGPYRGSLLGRAKASNALAEAGVPGIQYLDQASRGVGQGTRNYVIFDDQLIDIRKKY